MNIGYLITIIWAKSLYDKIERKIQDRLDKEGYVEVKKERNYYKEIIIEALMISTPILNVMFALFVNKHFDEYYERTLNNCLKEGKVRKKIPEDEIEYDEKTSNCLRINNILSAKSLQEENIPKWKKTIENIYYEIGSFLQKNNILNSNQYKYSDELSNERNKTKRL